MDLFKIGETVITESEILETLRRVGVAHGDVLFVHSDVAVFGKLATFDRNALLGALLGILEQAIGEEGTLIMPTFTDDFLKGRHYHTHDKSTVGVLTEFFRTRSGVVRTLHPFLSVAIKGPRTAELSVISRDAFDEHSIFGNVYRAGGKFLFFGASFQAFTFIHYVEQSHGVPYRFIKSFEGMIVDEERSYRDAYTYLVRPLDGSVVTDLSKLERHLIERRLLRVATLGEGRILCINAEDMFVESSRMLDQDIHYFLASKP